MIPRLWIATVADDVQSDKKKAVRLSCRTASFEKWSEQLDLNQRPLRPERSALAMLSYAPLAWCLILQPAMKTLGRDVDKRPTGCDISRVLFPCRGGPPRRGRRPFIWTRPCGRALPRRESGLPATQQFWATPSSLLGLAPGGVCRAGGLTDAAVRSYRTFSPLP